MKMKQYKNTDYFLTENGTIFHAKRMDRPRKTQMVNGFLQVLLFGNDEKKYHYVHHMVAETYLDNPEGFKCVKHKDRNSLNNHYFNLEYCTKDETHKKGVKHKKFKLEQLKFIYEKYVDKTYNQTELADMFGVKQGYISYLLKRYRERKIKV